MVAERGSIVRAVPRLSTWTSQDPERQLLDCPGNHCVRNATSQVRQRPHHRRSIALDRRESQQIPAAAGNRRANACEHRPSENQENSGYAEKVPHSCECPSHSTRPGLASDERLLPCDRLPKL